MQSQIVLFIGLEGKSLSSIYVSIATSLLNGTFTLDVKINVK
jgi:hypothetical protein